MIVLVVKHMHAFFSFGKSEKSISAARKVKLDQLFKVEAPNLVADIKSRFCVYCDVAFAEMDCDSVKHTQNHPE